MRQAVMIVTFTTVFVLRSMTVHAEPDPLVRQPVSISEIRELDDAEAAAGRPLCIRGVVTRLVLSEGVVRHLNVQDASAGIWVSVVSAREQGLWAGDDKALARAAVGSDVEIEGRTESGGFMPLVLPTTIRVLGRAKLPAAVPADVESFFSGDYTGSRVEVPGIVQGFSQQSEALELTLELASRRFVAAVPRAFTARAAEQLVDAEVRLRGVAAAGFNGRGEFLYPRVFVITEDDLTIMAPPRTTAFASPKVPLRSIGGPRAEQLAGHRLRTEGVVVACDGRHAFFVQEGATGVRVETVGAAVVEPGDRVEIAGFVDRRRMVAEVTNAVTRTIGRAEMPAPIRISPAEVVKAVDEAARRGQRARPGDFDGCLVQFPARVVEVDPTQTGYRLALAVDGLETHVTAHAEGAAFTAGQRPEPGSDLLATGVLQIHRWPGYRVYFIPRIDHLTLLVRSPADLTVLHAPPWWNARRLAIAAASLAAVLAAALAWAVLLRRQVAIETSRAAAEMRKRRDASIEFEATLRERSRLAANLHDTLLQALAGVVFQLDVSRRSVAAQRTDAAEEQIDMAKRMVKHAATDLRNSVWALRTAPLAGRSLADSLAAIVAHFNSDDAARVELRFEGDAFMLPNFVAGNLMLVVQEAVRNAVTHGRPRTVEVVVRRAPLERRMEIHVSDDGDGFEFGTQRGPDQGHFGLQGMRERIEGLGGTFSITSAPGVGTTITATVLVQEHDAELDAPAGANAVAGWTTR